MPNKIDITQTNTQLNTYITVWSGSNLTGPVRSVPIYNSSGTASVATAISDEYYLVRRGGEIIWAPIVSGGGSTLMFSLSPVTEESSNEPIGYFSAGKGLVSDGFLFQDIERIFDFTRIGIGNSYDSFASYDAERIFDFVRIGIGNSYDSFSFYDSERIFDFTRINTGNPYDSFDFYDSERIFDFTRIDTGTINAITGQETEALAIYATPSRDVTFYDSIFNDAESLFFTKVDTGTINAITGQETETLGIYATPPRDVTFYDGILRDNESVSILDIDKTINTSGGTFV